MSNTFKLMIVGLLATSTLLAQEVQPVSTEFLYKKGAWELTLAQQEQLSTWVDGFPIELEFYIEINGYADASGSKATNQVLSEKRAKSVADFLMEAGWEPTLITYVGHGAPEVINGKRDQGQRKVLLLAKAVQLAIPLPKADTLVFEVSEGVVYRQPISGSLVSIPPHALVDKNGIPIMGKVSLVYTEYRDMADVIASRLPMTYSDGKDTFNFQSGGMFTIQAYQNGEEVEVAEGKTVEVAFVLTDTLQGLDFYQLDTVRNWTLANELEVRKDAVPEVVVPAVPQKNVVAHLPMGFLRIGVSDSIGYIRSVLKNPFKIPDVLNRLGAFESYVSNLSDLCNKREEMLDMKPSERRKAFRGKNLTPFRLKFDGRYFEIKGPSDQLTEFSVFKGYRFKLKGSRYKTADYVKERLCEVSVDLNFNIEKYPSFSLECKLAESNNRHFEEFSINFYLCKGKKVMKNTDFCKQKYAEFLQKQIEKDNNRFCLVASIAPLIADSSDWKLGPHQWIEKVKSNPEALWAKIDSVSLVYNSLPDDSILVKINDYKEIYVYRDWSNRRHMNYVDMNGATNEAIRANPLATAAAQSYIRTTQLSSFGSYNWDIIFKWKNYLMIESPLLVDSDSSKINAALLYVIDYERNATIMGSPTMFGVSTSVKTGILVATVDAQLYMMSPAVFKKTDWQAKTPTMVMTKKAGSTTEELRGVLAEY